MRTASCSCGQLRVTVTGAPVRISICHCYECQKRSGSPFAAQARWPRAQVTIEGASTAWRRTGDEGATAEFHFCPTCGSTVWYEFLDMPDFVAVATGNFADSTFPRPEFSMYDNRRHPWLDIAGVIERD